LLALFWGQLVVNTELHHWVYSDAVNQGTPPALMGAVRRKGGA
jgi:hypothetical protein